jgi:hypothetical protein
MPEPIFNAGPVDTPYAYTVSGTGTVTPRACQAVYDGSGAGGDFIPACIFKSQSGHVISRAILQSTIAAGASAEVSWFPGVSPAVTSSAGSVLPVAFADFTTPLALTPWGGFYTAVTWALLEQSGGSVYTWPSGGDSTKIHLGKSGVYRFVYEWRGSGTDFVAPPATILSQVFVSVSGALSEVLSVNSANANVWRGDLASPPPWGPVGERVFNITGASDVQLLLAYTGATSYTINGAVAFIYRLGDVLA